jgi:hypothetical protein
MLYSVHTLFEPVMPDYYFYDIYGLFPSHKLGVRNIRVLICMVCVVHIQKPTMDTTTTAAIEFGIDVDKAFNPYVTLRPITEGVVNLDGPTLAEALAGASCDPRKLLIKSKADFVSGGLNRSTAFNGITVVDGEVVTTGQSSLGEAFERYLRRYDKDALIEIVNDVNHGVDVTRTTDLDPAFVARVRPESEEARHKVLRRKIRQRNSESVQTHARFVAAKVTEMIASGAVSHHGTIAEARVKGTMPYVCGSLTVEPLKPRLCYNCTSLNKSTVKRNVRLEGLDNIRR